MNAPSTSHAQQARRAGAFVHQTMRDRGMPCMRNELDAALTELSPMQLQQVYGAAAALAKGADGREEMGLLAALRTASAHATRTALAGAGAIYRADVLLPLASLPATAPTFMRELARLRRLELSEAERDQAATQLRAMCGPLDHSDLLHEPSEQAAPAGGEVAPASPRARGASAAPQALGGDALDLPERVQAAGLPEPPQPPRSAPARRLRHQVKIYGKSAALTCEAARVRASKDEEQAQSTVMIEGANAAGDGSFDWTTKIVFACTLRELPQLLAVLLGWHDAAEFKFHGGKDKSLSLQHQDHGLFVKLREARSTVAVPVADADRFALAMLVLAVMADNDPGGDRQAVLAVCRDVMRPAAYLAAARSPGRD